MPKLNDTFARRAEFTSGRQVRHWDTEIKGLGLFVGKTKKTWYYQYDVRSKTRCERIGAYPDVTAKAARERALAIRLDRSRGKGDRVAATVPTLAEATHSYLARPNLRSEENKKSVRAMIDNYLPDWLGLPLDTFNRDMVVTRHRELSDTPVGANNVFQAFRAIYNHAHRRMPGTDHLPRCPTFAIEWNKVQPRQPNFRNDLAVWDEEVSAIPNTVHRTFYRFLLTTGLRRNECAGLTWENVHEDHIHLPMTKNGRAFNLPIVGLHHRILADVRRLDPVYVFPASSRGTGHLVAPTRLKDFPPHAHRRTFTVIARHKAGVDKDHVSCLLNHTPQDVTSVSYLHTDYTDLIEPMQRIADVFEAEVEGLRVRLAA